MEVEPRDLFELLRSLELPIGDYAIFGSGPLIVRGITEATNDLDVLSRGAAWTRAQEVSDPVYLPHGLPFVRIEHVIRYKEIAARPKDLLHLRLLERAERNTRPTTG